LIVDIVPPVGFYCRDMQAGNVRAKAAFPGFFAQMSFRSSSNAMMKEPGSGLCNGSDPKRPSTSGP
jgi:hypothetical protein